MPIEFACEACKRLLRVPDGSGGLSCECPACRTLLEIPDPTAIRYVESASAGTATETSTLKIPCPKCSNELICTPELLGTRGQCKKCKYIFTISTERESPAGLGEPESSGLIFTCPKCEQLFEGQEEMRGRKGKCHACGEVFQIELRVPEAPTVQESVPKVVERTTARTNAAKASSKPKPIKAGKDVQLVCSKCSGVMQVPASAAGQTTACPYCKHLLHIPAAIHKRTAATSQPPSPALPAAARQASTSKLSAPKPAPHQSSPHQPSPHQPSPYQPSPAYEPAESSVFGPAPQGDWTELGDMSGAAGSPYATPNYGNFAPQQSASFAPRRNSGRRSPVVYVIPGIFLLLCGFGTMAILIYQMYQLARQWNELQAMFNNPGVLAFTIGAMFAIAVGLLQAVLQILGGIAMIRRVGLTSARVGAIFSCFPCLFCLGFNLPIGIWATVVCYTGRPDRDFDF
jgi:DNA-directed RNA polymerase subunit M/transcription elongation factor TFIIS